MVASSWITLYPCYTKKSTKVFIRFNSYTLQVIEELCALENESPRFTMKPKVFFFFQVSSLSLLSWKFSFNNPLAKANQQTSKKFLVCKKRTACLVLARKNYCMLKRKISAKPLWSYDFFFYINKRKPRYTWVLASFFKWKFGSQEYKVYYVWRESIKKKIYWFVVSEQK